MRYVWWTLATVLLVFAASVYIDLPGTPSFLGQSVKLKKGLDLAGGARILLKAPSGTSDADMNTARDVISGRVSGGLGVSEPQVSRVGPDFIAVELPGLSDQKQGTILKTIGQTGQLALTEGDKTLGAGVKVQLRCKSTVGCPKGIKVGPTNISARPPQLQIIVPGASVKPGSAQVGYDQAGNPTVNYTLEGKGSDDWCNYTTQHVQGSSAIVLDNRIVSDPTIQSAICGGQTQITGVTDITQAQLIATDLNYGALPVRLHVDSSQQVAATLGPEYVRLALLAGIIGLLIVALFMLLYYRLPGLIADLALVLYAAVVFAVYKFLGVTFTLAGIAGFILSIGMAVDANVLIFERMKEELRSGKTLGAAVESGFSRAFPSIRDSNASTLITTGILFWFGHNFAATVITGFATTLGIGVAVSFVTAVFVSHTFLRVLVATGHLRTPALFGVDSMTGGRQVA